MIYKTQAIVLRKRELGETDLSLTLLSTSHGKFQAVARGSRKVTARMMGRLEPMTELDAVLAVGKSMDVLTEARVTHSRDSMSTDLLLLACGSYLLEVFDCLIEPGFETPYAYRLLSSALTLLEAPANPDIVLRWCEIRLIGLLGYDPQTAACVGCDAPASSPQGWQFSIQQGGLLCHGCLPTDPDAIRISAGTIGLYAQLRRCPANVVPRLRADPDVGRQLEGLMRQHIAYRWPHRLKSLAFLQQVRGLSRRSC